MKPGLEVTDWVDHDDGSATLSIDMNFGMLVVLARRGLKALIEEGYEEYGYPNPQRAGDSPAGEGRDQDVPE